MRILYLTRESPIFPSGGIGTYLGYMVEAMERAGHEVFLFTWADRKTFTPPADVAPFRRDRVHIELIDEHEVWREVPIGSKNLSLATYLAPRIEPVLRDWGIEVIEATDFLSPALALFQALQTRAGNENLLCVTYNHGFIEDFYEADQIRVPEAVRTDLVCERQQCRASDLVIAPSRCTEARLASYAIRKNVAVVREPYRFERSAPLVEVRHDLTYIGRISISKGIDKLVYFANVIHPVFPFEQVKLVGRIVPTPFRTHEMRDYVLRRLSPELRDAVLFTGFLPRRTALAMLEPGAVCPSLGSAETFSYACVESVDRGLLPVVRAGTPMAEFFPPELAHHVFDETMAHVPDLQARFERLRAEAPAVLDGVRAHCRETLDPDRIAGEMGALYAERLARKKGWRASVVREPARAGDVTILMPIRGPDAEFAETVDSLVMQSDGPPKVLICNDGTPEGRDEWFDYARARLPDVRVVDQPNTGLLGARNTLIGACETRFAVFLDADDILASRCIARMLEAWNSSPRAPQAVIPQRVNFGESGELVLRNLLEDHVHLTENDFRMTALIETAVLREIGFDATRRNGEADDWAFWLRFTGRGHVGVMVPEPMFRYRFRYGSMSWPWSEGQHVGSHTLVREAILDMCAHDPDMAARLARALYAQAVRA